MEYEITLAGVAGEALVIDGNVANPFAVGAQVGVDVATEGVAVVSRREDVARPAARPLS